MGNFNDLVVYRRAVPAADVIRGDVLRWSSFDQWTLGIQLVRSADSIGANLAEAGGRRSAGDERRFILIARGSAFETEHWIARADARGLTIDGDLLGEVREIGRMLNSLANRQLPED